MSWSTRLPDYSVSGSSDTTIFLLHGIYGAKEYWRFVTGRLTRAGYRVVAWDAPGYGLSPAHEGFSLIGAAESCARLIGKVGSSRNIVLGQSMGGQIALRTYQRASALIDGLIITSTIGYLGNKTPAEQEAFVKSRQSSDTDGGAVSDKNLKLVTSMMAANAKGADVDLVKAVGADTPGHAVQAAVRAIQAAPDAEAIAALKSIDVPTLFVAGQVDETGRPEGMRRLADMVPNSEFEVITGCGHYTWAEDPESFWLKIAPFLRRVLKEE